MAAQFDVFRPADGPPVVVLQSDLLRDMRTRVVAPLMPAEEAGTPIRGLTPALRLDGATVVLMPQLAATLTLAELGAPAGSLAGEREAIVRALDLLFTGV